MIRPAVRESTAKGLAGGRGGGDRDAVEVVAGADRPPVTARGRPADACPAFARVPEVEGAKLMADPGRWPSCTGPTVNCSGSATRPRFPGEPSGSLFSSIGRSDRRLFQRMWKNRPGE